MDQLTIQVAEPGTDWRTVKKDLSADAPARGAPANDGPPGPAGPGQHSGVRGLRAAGRSGHALVAACRQLPRHHAAPRSATQAFAVHEGTGPSNGADRIAQRGACGRHHRKPCVPGCLSWSRPSPFVRHNPPRVTAHLHQRTSQDPGDTFQRGLSVRQGGMARAIRKRLETIRRE